MWSSPLISTQNNFHPNFLIKINILSRLEIDLTHQVISPSRKTNPAKQPSKHHPTVSGHIALPLSEEKPFTEPLINYFNTIETLIIDFPLSEHFVTTRQKAWFMRDALFSPCLRRFLSKPTNRRPFTRGVSLSLCRKAIWAVAASYDGKRR